MHRPTPFAHPNLLTGGHPVWQLSNWSILVLTRVRQRFCILKGLKSLSCFQLWLGVRYWDAGRLFPIVEMALGWGIHALGFGLGNRVCLPSDVPKVVSYAMTYTLKVWGNGFLLRSDVTTGVSYAMTYTLKVWGNGFRLWSDVTKVFLYAVTYTLKVWGNGFLLPSDVTEVFFSYTIISTLKVWRNRFRLTSDVTKVFFPTTIICTLKVCEFLTDAQDTLAGKPRGTVPVGAVPGTGLSGNGLGWTDPEALLEGCNPLPCGASWGSEGSLMLSWSQLSLPLKSTSDSVAFEARWEK